MATVSRLSCKASKDLLRIIKAGPVNRVYGQPLALFSNASEEKEESERPNQKLCKGVNYLKDGQDPPLLPDSEYPDWLWTITETQPSNPENVQKHWRKINKTNRRQDNETRKQQRK